MTRSSGLREIITHCKETMARSMIALLIPFNNARRSLTSGSAHTRALKKRRRREPPKWQTLMFRGDKFTFFHVISSYREMAEVPLEIFLVHHILQVNTESSGGCAALPWHGLPRSKPPPLLQMLTCHTPCTTQNRTSCPSPPREGALNQKSRSTGWSHCTSPWPLCFDRLHSLFIW